MAFNLGDIFVTFKAKTDDLKAGVGEVKNLTKQVETSVNNTSFKQFSQNASASLKNVGDSMKNVGRSMSTFVTLPIVAGAGLAIKAASDLNETINKIDVAFKDQAKTVKDWAKTSLTQMGLAKASAMDAAALFGDMSTAMGLNTTEAAKMSMGLVQLGADMASFKNVSFDRAQTALAGIYTGETEALKGLGIVMTETNLEAFRVASGIKKTIDNMTQAEKVQLRYAYVMSVTTNAQGDFARTADGAANQTRMYGERIKELQANIGQKLLPIYMQTLALGNRILSLFDKLSDQQQKYALAALGVVAAIGPMVMVLGHLATAMSFLIAHPIVAAVMAIIAVLIYLQKEFNWVGQAVDFLRPIFNNLVALFNQYMMPSISALASTFTTQLLPALGQIWDSIVRVWNALNPALMTAIKVVAGIIGAMLVVQIWIMINVLNVASHAFSLVASYISNLIGWVSNLISWLGNLYAQVWNVGAAIVQRFGWIGNSVADVYNKIVSTWQGLGRSIGAAVANIGDTISAPFRWAFNKIVSYWNNTVGGLNFSAPDWVPGLGGKGWSMPKLSYFAGGVENFGGGWAVMGERGPELAYLPKGSNVYSNDKSKEMVGKNFVVQGDVNIGSQGDADYFFTRFDRDVQLESMGLSPATGV